MKKNLIILFTCLSLSIFAQVNMNEDLGKLFLDLNLNLPPKFMISNSPLKFEWAVRRGILWNNDGKTASDDTHTFSTEVNKNPFIESKTKNGHISIIQTNEEMKRDIFSINESFEFYNSDDMINEYYNLISVFEKFGYRVKNSSVQNENYETKFEFIDILIGSDLKKSKLTISYSMPSRKEKDKIFLLTILYINQDDKKIH